MATSKCLIQAPTVREGVKNTVSPFENLVFRSSLLLQLLLAALSLLGSAALARAESLSESDHKKLLRELETRQMYELYIRHVQEHPEGLDETIRAKCRLYQLRLQRKDPAADQAAVLEQLVSLYDKMILSASEELKLFSPAARPENPDAAGSPPSLSPLLQKMLDENQTDLLDWMLEVTQIRLLQQAGGCRQQLEFYADRPRAAALENLTRLVTLSDSYLTIVKGAIEDLLRYMEWYPGTDWKERFGDTRLYPHLQDLQRGERLCRGVLRYYQSCLNQALARTTPETAENLRDAFRQLGLLRKDLADATGGEAAQLALWQIRIAERLIPADPNYYSYTQTLVKDLLSGSPGADSEYEIRFAWTACELAACRAKPQEGAVPLRKLHQWLESQNHRLTNLPDKRFQAALLTRQVSEKEGLAELKKLAETYPSLRLRIHTLIAAQLAESFAAAEHPAETARNWDDFALACLGQYYLSQPQPDYEKALQIYDMFLQSRPPENEEYPQALYNAGVCCYQLGEKMASPELAVRAIHYWRRLSRDFPLWLSRTDPQQQNSRQAAVMAATLAYQLFSVDAETYAAVAREAITGLTGTIDPNQTEPAGPYANCEKARQFRYFAGLVLQQAKEYASAAAMFAAVPREDANKLAAEYYAILCKINWTEQQTPSPAAEHYTQFTTALQNLLALWKNQPPDAAIDPGRRAIAVKAATLLAKLYLECDPPQPREAIAVLEQFGSLASGEEIPASDRRSLFFLQIQSYLQLGRTREAVACLLTRIKDEPADANIQRAALQALQQQDQEIRSLHAEGKTKELTACLAESLPLAQALYSQIEPDQPENTLAAKLLLERACLLAVAAPDQATPLPENVHQQAESLFTELANRENASRTLWLVRCQALWEYARGDYPAAQQLWYQIRQGINRDQDELSHYYWWEARYFGLCCLWHQGQGEEVLHILEVDEKTNPGSPSLWKPRLLDLQNQIRSTPPAN